MYIGLSQIKRFVKLDPGIDKLVETLDCIGHEVEEVVEWPACSGHAVGVTISEARPHPENGKLSVYTVSAGAEALTVVSTVAGLPAGMTVAAIRAGGQLGGQPVEERAFGAVSSQAVFTSAADLGIVNPEGLAHEQGILRLLPDGCAGSVSDILGLPDTRLLVKPTPNRGDCLSALGIARELAARLDLAWQLPQWSCAETPSRAEAARAACERESGAGVELGAIDSCAYYALATISLAPGRDWSSLPSPSWLQEDLRLFGQKPVSLLVDLSNYCQFMYGQPMHVFDAGRIAGAVSVRQGAKGEILTTLDHRAIELGAGELVIADEEKPIAMAGVYGGDSAEISGQTRRIAVEVACFDAEAIRGTARRCDLHTEAALRYERGIDESIGDRALLAFVDALKSVCDGAELSGIRIHRRPRQIRVLKLALDKLASYLGFRPDNAETISILASLGFAAALDSDEQTLSVTPPPWRADISEDVCLIEEILRMGFIGRIDKSAGFSGAGNSNADIDADTARWRRHQQARRDFISRGMSEICGYSFISADDQHQFSLVRDDRGDAVSGIGRACAFHTAFSDAGSFADGASAPASGSAAAAPPPGPETDSVAGGTAPIVNPMSADMSVMRRSLIPGLCRLLAFHRNRQYSDARFFELGSIYSRDSGGISQNTVCAGLISGRAHPEQWGQDERPADYYDALGLMLDHLRLFAPTIEFGLRPSLQAHLHPLRSADIIVDDEIYGCIGQLHPGLSRHFEIPERTLVFEFDCAVYELHQPVRSAALYSSVPHIRRDLSFEIPDDLPPSRLIAEIRRFAPLNLKKSTIFDIYSGKNLEIGCKSVSLLLIFGRKNTNLLESEIDETCRRLVDHLQNLLKIRLRN